MIVISGLIKAVFIHILHNTLRRDYGERKLPDLQFNLIE